MTRLSSHANMTHEDIEHKEFEKERDAHADTIFYAIEEARNKMSPEDRKKADAKADAILENALSDAAPLRRRA